MGRFLGMNNMIDGCAGNLHKNINSRRLSSRAQVIIHSQRVFILFDCLQNFVKKRVFGRIITLKPRASLTIYLQVWASTPLQSWKKSDSTLSLLRERWQRSTTPPPSPPPAAFSQMQRWNTTAADSVTRRVVARVHSSKQSQSICQPAA